MQAVFGSLSKDSVQVNIRSIRTRIASLHTIYSVATQLNSSLLTLSVIAVLLPAAFHMNVTGSTDSDEGQDILKVSHGVRLMFFCLLVLC